VALWDICKKLGQLPSAVLREDAGILRLLEIEEIMRAEVDRSAG
jgi:hypothetical protein